MKKLLLTAAGVAALASTAAIAQNPQQFRGDRVQTRNEVVQHVQSMFARLDTNRDGFITQAESQAARAAFKGRAGQRDLDPAARQQRADRAFERLDTNRDGSISRTEFAARGGRDGARHAGFRRDGNFGQRIFAMADLNRDNRVSLQEATTAALQHFDRADLNRDGQVTPQERQQMRQQWQQQAPRRG
jgi:Ca2+-binding EF-hand superfamily protein